MSLKKKPMSLAAGRRGTGTSPFPTFPPASCPVLVRGDRSQQLDGEPVLWEGGGEGIGLGTQLSTACQQPWVLSHKWAQVLASQVQTRSATYLLCDFAKCFNLSLSSLFGGEKKSRGVTRASFEVLCQVFSRMLDTQ